MGMHTELKAVPHAGLRNPNPERSSEVLGLASCHSEESENRRYARMISPNIPLCDLASLNWVSHRVPSSLLSKTI